jgi:hypothetical protein
MSTVLELKGRIYKDPDSGTGMYISAIDAWDVATRGRTIDEAVQMTWKLIDEHLDTARKLGILAKVLAQAGAVQARAEDLRVEIRASIAVEGKRGCVIGMWLRDVALTR